MSANLNGSSVFYGSLTNVGDGWGYGDGLSAQGMNSAVSATGAVTGLGHSNFSGANNALDGLGYGLLSAGDDTSTGNTGVTGHGPLVLDSSQFVLTAPTGFSLSELGNTVVFQYGTALTDQHYNGTLQQNTPVPEPGTLAMFGSGLIGLAGVLAPRSSAGNFVTSNESRGSVSSPRPFFAMMRMGWALSPAAAQQQDLEGSEEDVDVEADGDVLDVEQVVGQLVFVVFDGGVVAAIDLRPSRRAGLDQPTLLVERNDCRALFLFVGRNGAGTYEGDVAFDDVEKLRKFVEPGAPQPLADARNARVIVLGRRSDVVLVRVGVVLGVNRAEA